MSRHGGGPFAAIGASISATRYRRNAARRHLFTLAFPGGGAPQRVAAALAGGKMAARVKNWKKFQHFKDRKPPWIKLYRDLLDDPDWHELSGDEAKALVMIWLVASENDGKLPDNRKLAFRLRIDERQVETLLKYCMSHWLDRDDIQAISSQYQSDSPLSAGDSENKIWALSHAGTGNPPIADDSDAPLAVHEIGRWRSAVQSDAALSDIACDYAPKAHQNTVRVTPGTPQWNAWLSHYASRNKLTHRLMSEAGDFNLHFLVPSEYPPPET